MSKEVTKIYELASDTFKSFKMKFGEDKDGKNIMRRVEFTGGADLGEKGKTPGKLATSDPELQKVIESNPCFTGKGNVRKEIFIRREINASATEEEVVSSNEAIVLDDITTVSAAKIALKEKFGDKVTDMDLKNKGSIEEFCMKNNVKIPGIEI